jgi:GYF domain 2
MLYYYLDGLDKKGPYNPDELKSRNLTQDTLVFSEGMSSWKSIKEVPQLYSLLFGVQIERESENLSTPIEQNIEPIHNIQNRNSPIANKTEIKKIKIPSVIFLFIGIIASVGLSYIIVHGQRTNDKKAMQKKINELFQGKDEICDFNKTGVQGRLQNVVVGRMFEGFGTENNAVKVGEMIIFFKPATPSEADGGEDNIRYQDGLKKWSLYKELVDYYKCTSGGFTVLTLSKENKGFDLVKSYSKNMGFKVPASRYTPGVDYGYGISTQGYSTPTNRGTVQEAYNGAMEYLSKDKENKSYVAGSYNRIKMIDEISTDFYYIHNVGRTWESSGDAYVFNTDWVVWYAYDGKHYEIDEHLNLFNKRWAIYCGLGSLIALFIYFLIRYRRRITIQVF